MNKIIEQPVSSENLSKKSDQKDSYLFLSAHDFRSPRKASVHFIAEEMALLGQTRFFSLRYSFLSKYKRDPRLSLDNQANKVAQHHGVECYLWKSFIHPFNTRRAWLRPLESLMYQWYSRGRNAVLQKWIKEATVIILESGIAPVFYDLIKQLNPNAKLLYLASDSLEAINVAEYVNNTFERIAKNLDSIVLTSKALAETIPSEENLVFVPHGIDHSIAQKADPSPYKKGIHAVSVGSMLFDPSFFIIASKCFPEIHFHIIGSGHPHLAEYGPNVSVYGEMPFAQTLPYIKHAQLGIAPYCSEDLPRYLRDTSMKLMQYAFFGLPAICPQFIAADYEGRFGYTIGDEKSIEKAIRLALSPANLHSSHHFFTWGEVAERMLMPEKFSDTRMCA